MLRICDMNVTLTGFAEVNCVWDMKHFNDGSEKFWAEESNVSEAESISGDGKERSKFGEKSSAKNNSKNSVINTFLHHCLLFT